MRLAQVSSLDTLLHLGVAEQTWTFRWDIDGLVLFFSVTLLWILSSFSCQVLRAAKPRECVVKSRYAKKCADFYKFDFPSM